MSRLQLLHNEPRDEIMLDARVSKARAMLDGVSKTDPDASDEVEIACHRVICVRDILERPYI